MELDKYNVKSLDTLKLIVKELARFYGVRGKLCDDSLPSIIGFQFNGDERYVEDYDYYLPFSINSVIVTGGLGFNDCSLSILAWSSEELDAEDISEYLTIPLTPAALQHLVNEKLLTIKDQPTSEKVMELDKYSVKSLDTLKLIVNELAGFYRVRFHLSDRSSSSIIGLEFDGDERYAVDYDYYIPFCRHAVERGAGLDFKDCRLSLLTGDSESLGQAGISEYLWIPLTPPALQHLVDRELLTVIESTTDSEIQPTSEKPMSSVKDKALTALATNKTSALLAAQVTVGKAANTIVIKAIKPKLPLAARGFVTQESFVSRLIAANIAAVAVAQFMPTNPKALAVSQAMMHDAYLSAAEQFDVEGMMDEMLSKLNGKKVDTLIEDVEIPDLD